MSEIRANTWKTQGGSGGLTQTFVGAAPRIGIGTTVPDAALHIYSGNNAAVKFTYPPGGTNNNSWHIQSSNTSLLRIQALTDAGGGGGNLFDFYRDAQQINEFRGVKNGVPWFVVDNFNKKVGINSTSPTYELDVDGTVNATSFIGNGILRPGSIIYFASSSQPEGYLKANGAAVSRTTYANLFAIIGTTYGAGDGSTTFNLPDLRGEFIRGWDDGRGADSGRTFGSFQDWAIENITGAYSGEARGNASGAFADVSGGDGGFNGTGSQPTAWDFDASRVVKTSTETRPRNIALLACIRY